MPSFSWQSSVNSVKETTLKAKPKIIIIWMFSKKKKKKVTDPWPRGLLKSATIPQ